MSDVEQEILRENPYENGVPEEGTPEAATAEELPTMRRDYVLVERGSSLMSEGGLHIPDTAQLPYVTVVAMGPGMYSPEGKLIPIEGVKIGDRVLIDSDPNFGLFKWGSREFGVTREMFIRAILPKTEPRGNVIVKPSIELVRN